MRPTALVVVALAGCCPPPPRPLTDAEFDAEWARAGDTEPGPEIGAPPGLPNPHLYPPVRLAQVAARDGWVRPRALIEGKVILVKQEDDGDHHFVVTDGTARVVCEIVPELPLPHPTVGQTVQVWGVARYDGEHRWGELHPVIGWRVKP